MTKKIIEIRIRNKKNGKIFRAVKFYPKSGLLECYTSYGHFVGVGIPVEQLDYYELLQKIDTKVLVKALGGKVVSV